MSFEESITFHIGGTMRLRWLAVRAVIRRFRWHFLVGIAAWLVLGLYLGHVVLHMTLTLALTIPIACNVLGIDPAQLLMRGEVTFTSTEVYWTDIHGQARARGWQWVKKAEEADGNLHIVFGPFRTRAIASKDAWHHHSINDFAPSSSPTGNLSASADLPPSDVRRSKACR